MKTILALFAVLSLLLSAFAIARPVGANHEPPDGPEVTPESQPFPTGGPTCLDIDGIAVEDGIAIRFGDSEDDAGPMEDEATATVTLSDGSEATVQIFLEEDEGEFVSLTFVVEGGLAALVKVKGANQENIYDYTDFTGGGVAHDDGLVTPTGQEISHIDFCLVPVDASIIVYKTDQTGADVAGAEFTVFDGETAVAGPALTDADGLVCFDGLVLDKVYTVVETDTPDGWLPADPDNQNHEAVQGDCEEREGADPDLTFTNTLLGSLLVRKLDDSEPPAGLPGAEFTITGPNDFETTATSDANGWFCLDGLVFGAEYTVTETAAPDGYVIAGDNPQSHTIDDTATCAERVADSPTADLVFTNESETGSITIIKEVECETCETLTIGYWFNAAGVHDAHTDALLSGGIEADGETFTSADQVRAYIAADISGDSDGQPGLSHRGQLTIQYLAAVLNVLNNGDDCELAERVFNDPDSPFDGWTVEEVLAEAEAAFDGTSSFSDEDIKDALDAINNSTQADENPLTCEGSETGTLDGVEFTIFLASAYPDGTPEATGTTGDDGAGTVVFGGLTIGEDYVIVETGFPDGLTCEIVGVSAPGELIDGAIHVTLAEEDLDEFLNLTLTVENECEEEQEEELGSLLIAKTDDSEEPMLVGGATFEVDGVAYADEDGDGWVCVDGLTLGDTVAVEETVAPAGYIGQEGVVDVPVTSTDDCETRLEAEEPTPDVTFVNALDEGEETGEIEVAKVDQDENPLSGATFKLYLDDGDGIFDPEDGGGGGDNGDGGGTGCTGDANIAAADATAIANAIVADGSTLSAASFDSVPPSGTPNGTAECLSWFPTNGSSFGILTSGDVNIADDANNDGGSGASLGGASVRGDTDFDVTVLKLDLTTPSGANCLQFDFAFYSEEFPEFVESSYNDAFIAEFGSSTWTTSGSTISAPNNFAFDPDGDVISINSTGATAMNEANAVGTTYDGATVLLTAATPAGSGMNSLYLSIFDQGDMILDSAVFVDNVRFLTVADVETECVAGAQEAEPGGDTLIDTKTTEDGTALFSGLDAGIYWLQETSAPDGCEIVTELTQVALTEEEILAGEPKVVTIENDCEDEQGGGTAPGGGGTAPGEGTLGGQVPNTATAPELTGSLAAALLALVMLTGLGAAGYAMQAEARRRR